VSPLPDERAIANLYGHDDAHVSADELIASTATYGRTLKARLALGLIRSHVQTGDLLEIGAGGGGFLQEAAKHGYNVSAAEFNPIQVEYIRSLGFDCRQG